MNVVERMARIAMVAHNGVNRDGHGNVPYVVRPHWRAETCRED